jgi:hypothetical protein
MDAFPMKAPLLLSLSLLVLLGACDQLGIPNPAKTEARQDADGKAIGSACRHAGRAIEDCYTLNQSASKAAVFAGWKEMNDYMVENKIAEVAPQLPPPQPPAPKSAKKPKTENSDGEEDGSKTDKGDKTDKADKSDKGEKAAKGEKGDKTRDTESPRRRRRNED